MVSVVKVQLEGQEETVEREGNGGTGGLGGPGAGCQRR